MLLPDLTLYLESQSIGVRGTSLFYGVMEDSDILVVCLYDYPGRPIEPNLGKQTNNLEYPFVQAVVRGVANDQVTPRQKAQDICTAFAKVANQLINGTQYKAILAKQSPFKMRQDENFKFYIACNFEVTKEYTP